MSSSCLHVAVAIIEKIIEEKGSRKKFFLIAKRPEEKDLGGLWEFPGGKVEEGESVTGALLRELEEELDIRIKGSDPFIKIRYQYPAKEVLLDVHKVSEFTGLEKGNEGQQIKWVAYDEMAGYEFPPANKKILDALKLPKIISITPDSLQAASDFKKLVASVNSIGGEAILLREKRLSDSEYQDCFLKLKAAIHDLELEKKIQILVNRDLKEGSDFDGRHLSSSDLQQSKWSRKQGVLLSASCHNLEQIRQAEKLACDFVFVSPVMETGSHPNAEALGWEKAGNLAAETDLPVFFLGGLSPGHLNRAKEEGGFGVAGIREFFPDFDLEH